MDGWSIALWVGAGYVAVVALIRLMAHKRKEVWPNSTARWKKKSTPQGAAVASKCRPSRPRQSGVERSHHAPP